MKNKGNDTQLGNWEEGHGVLSGTDSNLSGQRHTRYIGISIDYGCVLFKLEKSFVYVVFFFWEYGFKKQKR